MILDEEREYKILVLRLLHFIGRNLPPGGIPEDLKEKSNDMISQLNYTIEENYKSYIPEDK